jgi:hypothetical protein
MLTGCGDGKAAAETTTTAAPTTIAISTSTTEAPAPVAPPVFGTLGFAPEQFADRWNETADELGSSLRMRNVLVEEGQAQNLFEFVFTENLEVSGFVNKADGTIRSLTLDLQTTSDPLKNAESLGGLAVFIVAVDPGLMEVRSTVLEDLGLFSGDLSTLDQTIRRNGYEYRIEVMPSFGLIRLTASDVNDNA